MSILREVETVRRNFGVWTRSDHTLLQVTGRDAGSWLQSQTTNDLAHLASGEGCLNCLLDRKGRVQAVFSVHRWEDEYWILLERSLVSAIFDRIETHLFLEDVTVTDVGANGIQVLVEGPRSLAFLSRCDEGAHVEEQARRLPAAPYSFAPVEILGHEVLAFRLSESGEDGYLLLPDPTAGSVFYDDLAAVAPEFLGAEVSEAARTTLLFEAGPRFGVDIDSGCIVSETPLEREAVSYSKGCYLGQEIVARLKAYGTPKQALVALLLHDDAPPPVPGTDILAEGSKVGHLRSQGYSPTLRRWFAYAYLDRDHRIAGAHLLLTDPDGRQFAAEVAPLPVYCAPSREDPSRRLYEAALGAFEQDRNDERDEAIELLKEAILLQPAFEDAYEALGVILHRHHRVDEAIHYMRRLEALNPNSVMAHSNLSVFYMTKGMIAEAEDEKARAAQLEMKQELDARTAQRTAEAERARLRAEAESRIAMFLEVLEIDPEDPIATMGLGSAYMQLDRPADAIPDLRAAACAKKDYSAAFLKLGQCQEIIGDHMGACETYRQGIAVASRKGDLMPLREMERRLKALQAPGGESQETQ
ncbi:MAG: tetratricopeptide repeat protein [Candidatus Hydrogenedentes bacterium]|nr:tetratricopeptide repeat protein [Candidatus Hydrogenedentota bacterium]